MQSTPPLAEVRACRLRDVAAIRALLQASWHDTNDGILGQPLAAQIGRRVYSRLNLAVWIARSLVGARKWHMLIADHGGAAVGCAMAEIDDKAEIILYMLYVHPGWKGRGIGSALLHAVAASYAGARSMRLEVLERNTPAVAWYKAKGFVIYGETKHATGTTDITSLYMDKPLAPQPGGERTGA
jgi:ribosomal protein S18 acetylase RimI-like enzyme